MPIRNPVFLGLAASVFCVALTARVAPEPAAVLTVERTRGVEAPSEEPPLRLSDSMDAVVADLETFIPARMQEARVPGLAIALIRENEVVWTQGFGQANRITGRAVTPDTVFEAASISKVVTTYIALRLVEQGKLALDAPLCVSLKAPWLPSSEYADKISLRHLASHSSGLTENVFPTIDKTVTAEPGSRFLYTGLGFMYMQEAVEQVTGQSLEAAAREHVLEPLGMTSSSFVLRPELLPHVANGHLRPAIPLLAFLVPAALLLGAMAVIGVPIVRLVTGKWGPSRRMTVGAALLAGALSLLFLALSSLSELRNFLLLIGLCAAAFAVLLTLAFVLGGWLQARLPVAPQGRKARVFLGAVWVVAIVVTLVAVSGKVTVPVPRRPSPPPSAVGSLRTTAGDLALFLIELAKPRFLSREMAAEIATPQIPAGNGFSWGLGIGIQHSAHGEALWQNAQTFGYRGLMVIYPEHGSGVVVLTNSDDGYPVACDVAGRALGGKARWQYF